MSNITSHTLHVININNISCCVMLNDNTDATVVCEQSVVMYLEKLV